MRIDLISAKLPPAHDAIGEYTANLAATLAQREQVEVRVLTSDDQPLDGIAGVEVVPCFSLKRRAGVKRLVDAVGSNTPDALVLQYNPFSWGRWGLNLELPSVLQAIKRQSPSMKAGVMFHEKIVPPTTWKFRVMRLWQVRQYEALADVADVRFFSIQKWADEERQRRPDRLAEDTVHLPVGSNLPYCPPEQAKSREQLGIPEGGLVCGVFGSAHPSRRLDWVAAAVAELRTHGHDAWLLYIGGDGDKVRRQCQAAEAKTVHGDGTPVRIPLIDTGRLPAPEAAACFPVMDLYLSPFTDGLSTRRGSAMAALQHGVAVVSTKGPLTDDVWAKAGESRVSMSGMNRGAFVERVVRQAETLKPDQRRGRDKHICTRIDKHLSWPSIASEMLSSLRALRTTFGSTLQQECHTTKRVKHV